jgi:hypothetical protein
MSNNQRFGIVKEEIDTWVAAETIVAVTERLVNRYLLTGEKTEKELGEQVAQMFLGGILNHSKSGDWSDIRMVRFSTSYNQCSMVVSYFVYVS